MLKKILNVFKGGLEARMRCIQLLVIEMQDTNCT